MNKVILMGRLVKEPEVRYSQGVNPVAVARYTLAVSRRLKKEGEPEADFINCVAFGKSGEFVERFFRKGQMVSVVGRLQVRSWDDKDGTKRWNTEVVTEEHYFAEERKTESYTPQPAIQKQPERPEQQESGFYPIEGIGDSDLPF